MYTWPWLRSMVVGPDLYAIYDAAVAYEPTQLEAAAGWALGWARTLTTMTKVFAPVVLIVLYRRDFFTSTEASITCAVYMFVFYTLCVTARTAGRWHNQEYNKFAAVLNEYNLHKSPAHMAALRAYDFDTSARPVTYAWQEHKSPPTVTLAPLAHDAAPHNYVLRRAHELLCYAAANTVGVSLMFPGTFFDQANPALVEGRRKLLTDFRAARASLRSRTDDMIDTVFIDRRPSTSDGATLVISCEGNCGFYEVGVGSLANTMEYSVLAWNKPGFAGSTGTPWPRNVAAAIDVVTQYAINELHFAPDKIVVFAWSIGGYAATHIGMQYASTLGGVVLDATFDDVMPLAKTVLPAMFESIIETTVRRYLDLPCARQLCAYDGPVVIIRRTNDEMITSRPHGTPLERLQHNRSNDLLRALLTHRYPQLFIGDDGCVAAAALIASDMVFCSVSRDETVFDRLNDYVNAPDELHRAIIASQLNTQHLRQLLLLATDGAAHVTFPLTLPESALLTSASKAQMAVHLASTYMTNVHIGHNDKLPIHAFSVPTHPWMAS